MKPKLPGILATLLIAGAAWTQAATIPFDDEDAFSDHFTTWAGSFPYNAPLNGVRVAGNASTAFATFGTEGFIPRGVLTETLSTTFSLQNSSNSSIGLVTRVDTSADNFRDFTGVAGLVSITSNSARIRIGTGTVYGGAGLGFTFDQTFSGLSLTSDINYLLSFEQRNLEVGSDLQAQFRLILSDADSNLIYADSLWQSLPDLNSYVTSGAGGLRIYPVASSGNAVVGIYDFSVIPEPSVYSLVLLAGGAAWMWRRREGAMQKI